MNSFDRPVRGIPAGGNRRRASLTIDVFFDFICPWCWIGTRHLASALRTFATLHPEVKTKVRWRPYPLLPDTPAEGLPYQAFYLSRLGSRTAVSMRRAEVQCAGQAAGIDFDFTRVTPGTVLIASSIGRVTENSTCLAPSDDPCATIVMRGNSNSG